MGLSGAQRRQRKAAWRGEEEDASPTATTASSDDEVEDLLSGGAAGKDKAAQFDDGISSPCLVDPYPKTWGFYVCWALLAGPVYLISPICWVLFLRHFYLYLTVAAQPGQHWFYRLFLYMSFLELPYSIAYQYLSFKAQARKPYPSRDPAFLKQTLRQCLDVGLPLHDEETMDAAGRRPQASRESFHTTTEEEAAPVRKKLRKWFHGASLRDIKRGNVKEWLAWAIADGRTIEEAVKDEVMPQIEEALGWVEGRLRWSFESGYNPNVKALRLTIDPVGILMRPLGYYIVCNGVTLLTYSTLYAFYGFRFRRSSRGLDFLVKPASTSPSMRSKSAIRHPIIFLHGLGIGLGQYLTFLTYLAHSEKGVIILIQPSISTQIWKKTFLDPPSRDEYVEAIGEVARDMGVEKATVLSHSNGTMVHGWLLRGLPELCARNVLVDPVCFILHEADVCYSFLVQPWKTGMQVLLGYFVARELGIAHSISRDFQWVDMLLWEWEFTDVTPSNFHVVLGSGDFLLDAKGVVSYLKECGVKEECVSLMQGYQHGQALILDSEGMQEVLRNL